MSPAQQGDVLLTLLLSTPEPAQPQPFTKEEWDRVISLLNDSFAAYQALFWPSPEELGSVSAEWARIREVAMPAFLHYFNTGLIASPEQVRRRINAYMVPFSQAFADAGLLGPSDALDVADWIAKELESGLLTLNSAMDEVEEARRLTFENAHDVESARAYVEAAFPTLGTRVSAALDDLGTVSRTALVTRFGDIGERFWQQFSIGRGEAPPITYPTDSNVSATHPLVRLTSDVAMVPAINSLWTAILEVCETVVTQPVVRERYFTHRDRTLEAEASAQFRRLVSPDARVLTAVYESPESRLEHDAVIIDGNTVFIVESKASPPAEPFRDPDKAFTRLQRAFRADKGIQKGFEQAESVRSRLAAGETVRLYGRRGTEVAVLDPTVLLHRYAVVVTRDDYGVLATDLALLLEKDSATPFPWVVNILDLSSMAEAWEYLRWGTEELREYLEPRLKVHGKAFTSDELELVGYHLKHGSLAPMLEAGADRVVLVPSYSDFFDELYRFQLYGGDPPVLTNEPPVLMDLRASLLADEPVLFEEKKKAISASSSGTSQFRRAKGASRNLPCPCGSGRKYKKCCGQ